jgi:uncharacterized protein (TIGR02001 family)
MIFIVPLFSVFAAESKLSLEVASNYVFRGITQTRDKSAIQAAYQVSQDEALGLYGGVFASNVSSGTEVDIYGGFAFAPASNNTLIFDIGAIEYLYTETAFAPASHESYIGMQYDMSYIKYYFGEENARYLDIGTGFNIFADMELLLHFGEVFSTAQNGNDFSVTLQKDFEIVRIGLTASYEDKTPTKESELFAYISTGF